MSQKIIWGERVPRAILPILEAERNRAFREAETERDRAFRGELIREERAFNKEERERRDRLERMHERERVRERAREKRMARARQRREEARQRREERKEERRERIRERHPRRRPRMEAVQRPGRREFGRNELLRGKEQIWQELERNAHERGIEMPPLPDRLPLIGSLARERLAQSRIGELVRRGAPLPGEMRDIVIEEMRPDIVMERQIAREERAEQREGIKIERDLAKAEQEQEAQEGMVVGWIEDMLMKGELEHVDGDGVSYILDTPGEFIDKWGQIREKRGLLPLNDRTRQKIYAMDWPGLRRAVKAIRGVELPGEVKRLPRQLREAPPGFETPYVDIYGRPSLRRKGVFFRKDLKKNPFDAMETPGFEEPAEKGVAPETQEVKELFLNQKERGLPYERAVELFGRYLGRDFIASIYADERVPGEDRPIGKRAFDVRIPWEDRSLRERWKAPWFVPISARVAREGLRMIRRR